MRHHLRHLLCLCLCLAFLPSSAFAQHEHHIAPAPSGWSATAHAQAFLTFNLQERRFTDFRQVESTNWLMLSARRVSPRSRLALSLMASAEPFTLRRLGSAQVFQSGETLDALPLRDYQHPHDLVMGLDARFDWTASSATTGFVSGGMVGSPALGPTPFMHRASAALHPTAPLTHHMLDSSHITHGVVSAGVVSRGWGIEVSAFQGREPDENRLDLDPGPLDSVAARLSWARGPWRAHVSNGWLTSPERAEPGNVIRTTASIEYTRGPSATSRGLTWTAAIGRNDRTDHTEWGALAEAAVNLSPRIRMYTRAELVDRFILVDFDHARRTGQERHFRSRVGAWLVGADRELWRADEASAALGLDLTLHHTPANLRDSYGHPVSWHLYLRLAR